MKAILVDTQCLIAVTNLRDRGYAKARAEMTRLEQSGTRLVTTDAVLIEYCNALSKHQLRARAIAMVKLLATNPAFDVVHVTKEIYARSFGLYSNRPDKDWGLTDCISFEVLRERKLKQALTIDFHFQQAGFEALLGE